MAPGSKELPPSPITGAPIRLSVESKVNGVFIQHYRALDKKSGYIRFPDIDTDSEEAQMMGISSNNLDYQNPTNPFVGPAIYNRAQKLAAEGYDAENVYCLMRNEIEQAGMNPHVTIERSERGVSIERAVELLGRENVHGAADVELLYGGGFVDGAQVPSIPYTEADLAKSKKIFEKTGVQEMLVLFVGDADGKALTGVRMKELLQKRYEVLGLGDFIDEGMKSNPKWYKDERFFKEHGTTYQWKLITKQTIRGSKGKMHHRDEDDDPSGLMQGDQIMAFANTVGVPFEQLRRPEPMEMLHAIAVHLAATEAVKGKGRGERLLENEYHWSDQMDSVGHFVLVGCAKRTGAQINSNLRNAPLNNMGVCLSRDPSAPHESTSESLDEIIERNFETFGS